MLATCRPKLQCACLLFIAFSLHFCPTGMADSATDSDTVAETTVNASLSRKLSEGLVFNSIDKKLELKLGAYVFFDYAKIDQSRKFDYVFGDEGSGSEVRKGRISVHAKLFRSLRLKFQVSFEGDDIEMADAYLVRSGIPHLGELRIGQVKEPFGMEQQQSTRNRLFMEPALSTGLTPGRNLGLKFSNAHFKNRLTWSAGIFYDIDTFEEVSESDGLGFSARLTGLPLLKKDQGELLHLGLAFTHRGDPKQMDAKIRPESHLASHYLNTGSVNLDSLTAVGLEAAYQNGPMLLQGEYIRAWLQDAENDFSIDFENITITPTARKNVKFDTYYAQVAYVLTGETREYFPERGIFGTVTPRRNFGMRKKSRGPGAWEVTARFSHMDLNDRFVQGGEATDYSLGVNWYPNPSWRVMFNYIHADIKVQMPVQLPNFTITTPLDEHVNIFQMRVQFDFSPKGLNALAPHRIFGKD